MKFVSVDARDPNPLGHYTLPGRVNAVSTALHDLRRHRVIHVNSTAAGGGVAEMLRPDIGYVRGFGAEWMWGVLEAQGAFFGMTKSIHNALHGNRPLPHAVISGPTEWLQQVGEVNAVELVDQTNLGPGDVVILHDPQVAGMIPVLRDTGATILWRCHVGADQPNEYTRWAWSVLHPLVEQAHGVMFSRERHVPDWMWSKLAVHIVPPSIDPLSPKNNGTALPAHLGKSVVQVSRWDRLKDPMGLISDFEVAMSDNPEWKLYLVGPTTQGVADDPEAVEVLAEVTEFRETLPMNVRSRVRLVELPMDDLVENALATSGWQRSATLIAQHSIQEGFGLVVTEAMWKAKTVIANAVGGIQDQLGFDASLGEERLPVGRLCRPGTYDFIATLEGMARVPQWIHDGMGQRARERVRMRYLTDTALLNYAKIIKLHVDGPVLPTQRGPVR